MNEEKEKDIYTINEIDINLLSDEENDAIATVTILINKQQKEIEELKADNYELNNRINELLEEEEND